MGPTGQGITIHVILNLGITIGFTITAICLDI